MWVSDSSRGHAHGVPLIRSTASDGVHGALDRDPARLALALPGVPVAEREQRALDVDAQIAGDSGPHLRSVHVAAVRVRHQGTAHLEVGGRDADRAVHRVHRQVHRVVAFRAARTGRSRCARSSCHIHTSSGQRILQGAVACVLVKRAEQRHGGGRRPVPARLDRDEVHRQRVARLRALDVERAGLRVEVRELAHLARRGRSRPRTRPAKQSSVNSSRIAPGLTRATGAAPPNVQAYCPGPGR